MNSSSFRQIELPIEGMTCAACAARIEKNLNKLSDVQASVNFTNEKAHVNYDEKQVNTGTLINAIEHAGFYIGPRSVQLQLHKMTCAACAEHIEKALNKLPGVTATVNIATETAKINFTPGLVTVENLIDAVIKTGYRANEISDSSHITRRQAAYQAKLRLFWISTIFTLPLALQMGYVYRP
ncbi:copper ion binding protein [Nitrosomonas ureae]|uniref:Cu+-exporting ATPase n=1 Tax=Nitrosomonas ureae TaxID=44577 RepID=A0A1H2FLI7_9PROT|nr:Cu+-exporting ATPase [Nitrosomonas ureae]